MNEYTLLAWLRPELDRHGQWLIKSHPFTAEHEKWGRYSRHDKHGLIEANVDLADLAKRVRSAINNERFKPAAPYKPHYSNQSGGIPGSR